MGVRVFRVMLVGASLVGGIVLSGSALAASPNTKATVDRMGDVGSYTSVALDGTGFPVVSYYDATNTDLKVAHCVQLTCRGNTIKTSPDAGAVGSHTSLALDASGFPVVSYYAAFSGDLAVLHCNDVNCAGGDESITVPDTTANVGQYTSLVLDASGFPVVSYYDDTNDDLKLLHCNDVNCAGGDESITSPDTAQVGQYTSLALDSSGYPVVSYWDDSILNFDLKVLHCNDVNCAGGDESITSPVTSGGVGLFTSLALDSNGFPVVSHKEISPNFDLLVLHCNDVNCAGGDESSTSPDTTSDVGSYTSLVLDASGFPVISYYDGSTGDLKVMRCNDANCAGGDESTTSPDTRGNVGQYTSLVLDASGFPVVSYYDAGNGNLKVLHCVNANCE